MLEYARSIGIVRGCVRGCKFARACSWLLGYLLFTCCLESRYGSSCMAWHGRQQPNVNSLRLESIHWSRAFSLTLVDLSPLQAYFLSCRGIHTMDDVFGHMLPFSQAAQCFGLGVHYRQIWSACWMLSCLLCHLLMVPVCWIGLYGTPFVAISACNNCASLI